MPSPVPSRSCIEAQLRDGARRAAAAGLGTRTTRIALEGWGLTLRFEPTQGRVQVLALHPVLVAP